MRQNKNIIPFLAFFVLAFVTAMLSSSPIYAGIVQGNDSIYSFNVTNCQANVSTVGCNASTIRFECNVNPYAFIDEVQFMIDSSYRTTQRSGDLFWYDYMKALDYSDVNDTILLEREKITDVDNKSVLDFETFEIDHDCDVCDADYNCTYDACQLDNTQNEYCISLDPCASDYNDTAYCNYCDPEWTARTGGIYDCNETNQRYSFYDDFTGCYDMTGLPEDSPPADHDSVVSCSYYNTDMSCDVDTQPYLSKKINVICNIPTEHKNETFDCVTYVKPDLNSSNILQSNPEYSMKSQSIFSLGGNDIEDREFFQSQSQLVQAYYTDKNIETDRMFVVGVKCTSSNTVLVSEYPVTPTYRGAGVIMNRFVWAKNNIGFIMLGVLLLAIVIITVALLLKAGGRK